MALCPMPLAVLVKKKKPIMIEINLFSYYYDCTWYAYIGLKFTIAYVIDRDTQ